MPINVDDHPLFLHPASLPFLRLWKCSLPLACVQGGEKKRAKENPALVFIPTGSTTVGGSLQEGTT